MDEVLSRNYQYLFIKAVRSATCTPLALATDTGATIDRSQGLKTIALSTLSILPPPGVSFPRKEKTITGLQENAARCTRAAIQISLHISAFSPIVIIPTKTFGTLQQITLQSCAIAAFRLVCEANALWSLPFGLNFYPEQ